MSSTPSQPGASVRREVLGILREWLEEANDISYHFGGTPASTLGEALERISERTIDPLKEGDGTDPRGGTDLASR